jgi:branched-chain amino acid transport system substrate-binding protein
MHVAANLHHLSVPMMEPGITMSTSPTDYVPVKDMRLVRFDGKTWVSFGEAINGKLSQR